MIEFFRFLGSIFWSLGALSLLGTLAAIALLAVLPEKWRGWLFAAAAAGAVFTTAYGIGRYDERSFVKSRINREIGHAVVKGNRAQEEALRNFDAAIDLPDDGFRRD